MPIYQGPIWPASPTIKSLIAANLNCAAPSPTAYLQAGGLPSSATAANPPVITQPATWAVLLPTSGAPPVALAVVATTVTCGAGSVAQDNYVDLTPAGAYVVTTGAVGFSPSSPTAGNLRLYKATTGASNIGVATFTLLAATAPLILNPLGVDGTGAAATVDFAGNFVVGGTTQLTGALTASGNLTVGALTQLDGALTVGGDLTVDGYFRIYAEALPNPPWVFSVTTPGGGTSGSLNAVVHGDGNRGTILITTGGAPGLGSLIQFTVTPAGGEVLLGLVVNQSLVSGATVTFLSVSPVTLSSGAYSVTISTAGTPLVANVSYSLVYRFLWA